MIRVISFTGYADKFFKVRTRCLDTKGAEPLTDALFFSYQEARDYVSTLRRKWILVSFNQFVKHKLILFSSSAGDYYRLQSRLNALTRLQNAMELLPTLATGNICDAIVKAEPLLASVLPHHQNHSYDQSMTAMLQLLFVAEEELSDKLGLFLYNPTLTQRFY